MRKFILFIPIAIVAAAFIFLSSCSKSHETPVKPNLSFAATTMTAKESDDTVTINLTLDKPAPAAFTVGYTVTGTATEYVTANSSNVSPDYKIVSKYLEVDFDKGATTASIKLIPYSDYYFEDNETAIFTLTNADNANIVITRNDIMTLTIDQEEGLAIALIWGDGENNSVAYPDVDMDLFLWVPTSGSNPSIGTGSANNSSNPPEVVFLPNDAPDGSYGIEAVYYSGSVDSVNFLLRSVPFAGDSLEFLQANDRTGVYKLKNIHAWSAITDLTQIEETFSKSGSVFSNFSDITRPADGSRVAGSAGKALSTLRRSDTPVSGTTRAFRRK